MSAPTRRASEASALGAVALEAAMRHCTGQRCAAHCYAHWPANCSHACYARGRKLFTACGIGLVRKHCSCAFRVAKEHPAPPRVLRKRTVSAVMHHLPLRGQLSGSAGAGASHALPMPQMAGSVSKLMLGRTRLGSSAPTALQHNKSTLRGDSGSVGWSPRHLQDGARYGASIDMGHKS